jgi:hypothetical protein
MNESQSLEFLDGPLDAGRPAKPKYRSATVNGRKVRIRVIDADSASFSADFQAAFKSSVRRARDESKAAKAGR